MSTATQYQFAIRDIVNSIADEYARKHKPGAGQLGLFENPAERQKPLFSKNVDDEAGKWVTMRGARVFISGEDGRIMKGPKALMGKTKEQIEKESAGKEGGGDRKPKPKGLAEMGKISGGRKENRQQKLFEELNPGFTFVDDGDEEDFKVVEPVAMAEAPSSPADESESSYEEQVLQGIQEKLKAGEPVMLVTNTKATQFDERHADMFRVKNGSLQVQRGKNWDNIAFGPLDHLAAQVGVNRPEPDDEDSDYEPAAEENILSAEFVNDYFNGDAGAAIEAMELNRSREIKRANELGASWDVDEIDSDWMKEVSASAEESGADDESPEFTLDSTPAPSPAKPTDFSNPDAATKQGALFDTGKNTKDLKGQELLFNSDAGDLNNPKTMENRVQQSVEEDGPNDGDTDETGLIFRNGRWHRDGQEISPSDIAAKASENGENIWAAAKRELGVNSMAEIPPELRKELGDAMAAASAGKAPAPKPPSPGRQKAMEKQEEKQADVVVEPESEPEPENQEEPLPEPEPESSPPAPITEAEETGKTPREQAGHYYDTEKHDEYAWARESEVSNAGKDLIGSARHKRNEWRSLEELERRGSAIAEELITRSNLLKNNPPNLAVAAERNPVTALAMHLALNAIPARPYGVKSGEVHVDSEKKKLARKLYVEAFNSLREKAEELAMREDDPMKALSEFANHADSIRNSYSAKDGNFSYDQYKHMINIHNRTQTSLRSGGYLDLNRPVGRRDKATDASTHIRKFAALARENYGEDWMEHDDIQEKAIDVISGSSIDKVFDIKKDKADSGKYKFNPSEAYVTGKTERKGGPSVDTSSVKKSQNVLLDSLSVSGLQYGNSMTDDERKHHTAKAAEAIVDLADALGLPDRAVGMNGKLGIAFGARGRAGAKAHFEPSLNVINLTRKTGAGSLAHEWAHFIDYNTGQPGAGQATRSMDGNQRKLKESWDSAKDRIRDAVLKAYSHQGHESRWSQVKYWTSDEEMFARFSERMVQKKLHDQGRENTYLVGLHKNSHPFWPTDAELEKSMPHLEAIYKAYGDKFEGEHGKQPKKDRYSRIQAISQEMNQIMDRYIEPEADLIQIDHYAHPLIHAAVGAGAMYLANKAFRGPMRSVAHMAIAAAMSAWMQSAMAAHGIPPAHNQASSSSAVSSPALTPFQKEKSANNSFDSIVQNAIAKHEQRSKAAENAPPSAAQLAADAVVGDAVNGGNSAPQETAGKEGARAVRPLKDRPDSQGASGGGSFNGDHPRYPAGSPQSKGGEFAPKGGEESGGQSGGSSAPEASSSPAESSSESPRNYPDNLNKPASEQTNSPERAIEPTEPQKSPEQLYQEHLAKIAASKVDPGDNRQRPDRRAAWEQTQQAMTQQILADKQSKKDEAKKFMEIQKATSFNPKELEAESSEDQTERQARKNVIPDIANEHDLDHETLSNAVQDELKMVLPAHQRQEEARQYIAKLGWHAGRINRNEDSYKDHSTTNLDENASEWAGLFPEIAGTDESEWVAKMWDLSKKGKQDPPSASDEDFVQSVAKRLVDQGYASSFSAGEESSNGDDENDEDYQPVHGQVGDVDYTPFSRAAVVGLIVDKYMRMAGIC